MSKRLWDAIIVGAGPAGSSAAIHLRKAGHSVLMLDRRQFPRPKPCGGLLSERAFKFAPVALTRCLRNTPSLLCHREQDGQLQFTRETVALVRRIEMDQYLFETARKMGAHFLQVRGIRKLRGGSPARIILDNRRWLESRFIIGADGSNSMVRRLLNEPANFGAFAIEAEIARPERLSRQQILFDFSATPSGYGWIFPLEQYANVGLARFDGHIPTRDQLATFLSTYDLRTTSPSQVKGAPINTFGTGLSLGSQETLLIGDAAGLVDDLTGEGICHAFQSAALAAEAIICSPEQPLTAYRLAMQQTQLPALRARQQQAERQYLRHLTAFDHYGNP